MWQWLYTGTELHWFLKACSAAALWRWMPAGDARDVLAGLSILGGLILGLIWDWGR